MKELNIALIDCGSDKVVSIKDLLLENDCQVSMVKLEATQVEQLNLCDGVIISGGPHLFTQQDQFRKLMKDFAFIPKLQKPTLGICLGHQAIGLYHGAEIYLGVARRQQEFIERIEAHPLLANLSKQFEVSVDHCEGITLADGFKHLASSKYYSVEAMANDEKSLYGVQFHPEVSPTQGKQVLVNFIQIVVRQLSDY